MTRFVQEEHRAPKPEKTPKELAKTATPKNGSYTSKDLESHKSKIVWTR